MPHLENFFAPSEAMDILLKIFVILVDNNRYDLPVFFKIPLDIWYIREKKLRFREPTHDG